MSAIAAAVVGGVGAIAGGLIASGGAKSAANAQAAASDRASQVQLDMFNKQNELNAPFREAGITSQNKLLEYMGLGADNGSNDFGKYTRDFGMQDFQQDPGYQFRMDEGMKALERSAAARGNLLSGSALKGITRFGQDNASQEYQNAFNRYQVNRSNQLNPLQSLMGSGQTATNAMTTAAGETGRGIGQTVQNAGAARASGYVGSANALGSALGGVANNIGQYLSYKGGYGSGGGNWGGLGDQSIFTPSPTLYNA